MKPLLLLFGCLLISGSCLGQSTQGTGRYSLRQYLDDTKMASKEVGYSSIPFNKKYAELTVEQKCLFKSQYDAMDEADEPPYPIGGLKDIFDPIARGQSSILQHGEVSVDIEIDAAGAAVTARVLKSPGPLASQLVAGVALLAKYKPGICRGTPCAMSFPVRVNLVVR